MPQPPKTLRSLLLRPLKSLLSLLLRSPKLLQSPKSLLQSHNTLRSPLIQLFNSLLPLIPRLLKSPLQPAKPPMSFQSPMLPRSLKSLLPLPVQQLARSRFLLCHKANRALSHPSRKASGFPRGNKTTRYTKYRRRQRLKAPHARPKGRQLQSQSHLRRLRLPRRHRRLLQSVSLPQRLLSLLGKLLSLPR